MFIEGKIYKRSDLHKQFGGQSQGGISTPALHKIILLFTGESGEQYGYSDGWTEDGIFLYTGEGQVGEMTFTRGNAAIRDHLEAGEDLHLFQYIKSGQVRYIGQMVCIGFQYRTGTDRENTPRTQIVFELAPINVEIEDQERYEAQAQDLALEELRHRALADSAEARTPVERKTMYRYRSHAIKLYALKRAGGVCEGCGQPAPFQTAAGEPYLEVHHIHRLSDGGPDRPEAVVAVCPNCHRRAHYAHDAGTFNEYLNLVALRCEGLA